MKQGLGRAGGRASIIPTDLAVTGQIDSRPTDGTMQLHSFFVGHHLSRKVRLNCKLKSGGEN